MSTSILSQAIPLQADTQILNNLIKDQTITQTINDLKNNSLLSDDEGEDLIKLSSRVNEYDQKEFLSDEDILKSCLKCCLLIFNLICEGKLDWGKQEKFIPWFHAIFEENKEKSFYALKNIMDCDELNTQEILKKILELGIKQIPNYALDCTVITMASQSLFLSKDTGTDVENLFMLLKKLLSGLWHGTNNIIVDKTLSKIGGWSTLAKLLENYEVREYFFHNKGVEYFTQEIKNINYSSVDDSLQEQQWGCYCVWMMSYNIEISESFPNNGILNFLQSVLKHSSTEKLIRIVLEAFLNISNKTSLLASLQQINLLRQLDLLSYKRFKDQDILTLIQDIVKILEKNMKEQSGKDGKKKYLQDH